MIWGEAACTGAASNSSVTKACHNKAVNHAAPRLQAYLERRGGAVADEPATAEALAAVVLRGLDCGAFTADEVLAQAPGADLVTLRNLKARTLS